MYQQFRVRLLGLMGTLMIDAILGMALTTFIDFDPDKHSATQNIFLVAHIVLAIGIVIGGIVQLAMSIRKKSLRAASTIGLLSTITAFVSGGLSADAKTHSHVAVFIMAVSFVCALGAYGYSLTNLKDQLHVTKM